MANEQLDQALEEARASIRPHGEVEVVLRNIVDALYLMRHEIDRANERGELAVALLQYGPKYLDTLRGAELAQRAGVDWEA